MLKMLEITGSSSGPRVLITGGVHGDEFEPMEAAFRLAEQLPPRLRRGSVLICPIVNEPAFQSGKREGPDGLDLARVCPGSADGLPTERIAHFLSQLIREADCYVDLHSGGTALDVYPTVGYMLHPERSILREQRSMARAFGLAVIWGTDYRLNGRTLSVARDAGVPAIYAEYRGGAHCDRAGIDSYVQGCFNLLSRLNMVSAPIVTGGVELELEDPREASGHMQICNPAPIGGIFVSDVRLGERVKAGANLGHVTDPIAGRTEPIRSPHEGLVLVLRTFPRVSPGDSLAVILES